MYWWTSILIADALALGAGLIIKFALDFWPTGHEISWKEYGIGAAVILGPLSIVVGVIGFYSAKTDVLTFNEKRNGFELHAFVTTTNCEEDGSCFHDYNCHPYWVPKTCENKDANGNVTSTYDCGHTEYHKCPYVTSESTFTVETTLGKIYTISAHRLPENPQAHRWDDSEDVPSSVIENYGTGIPPEWQAVWNRINSNWPGPVTDTYTYDNYILASDHTILKEHSDDIGRFLKAKVLPTTTIEIHDRYLADKVHFVGFHPNNEAEWQNILNRVNAALGMELQGDAQIVIVRSSAVDNEKDAYKLALKAYWQDKHVFGKDTMSKNGIGIIIGTDDGKTVAWSRAFTGMPLGNETMVVALENSLTGHTLNPGVLIGSISTSFVPVDDPQNHETRFTVKSKHSGVIASILWGDNDSTTRFTRVHMGDHSKDGHGSGYMYLSSEIVPTPEQTRNIAIIVFLLSLCVWAAMAVIGTDAWPEFRASGRTNHNWQ